MIVEHGMGILGVGYSGGAEARGTLVTERRENGGHEVPFDRFWGMAYCDRMAGW